ncbi:MAG: TonB-dependent receptor, partial [Bacteroidetes bacterium]|nr:TonB-dependent receptor [Bacteroidota bacterium]
IQGGNMWNAHLITDLSERRNKSHRMHECGRATRKQAANLFAFQFAQKFCWTARQIKASIVHKLDLNFIRKFMWFDLPFQFSISLYNAYNRQNPFAQTVKFKTQPILIPGTNQVVSVQSTPEVSQFTLFPLIPTLGLSVAF